MKALIYYFIFLGLLATISTFANASNAVTIIVPDRPAKTIMLKEVCLNGRLYLVTLSPRGYEDISTIQIMRNNFGSLEVATCKVK